MNRLSKKIILISLLTVFLLGGIGWRVKNIEAKPLTGLTQAQTDAVYKACPITAPDYSACVKRTADAMRAGVPTNTAVTNERASQGLITPPTTSKADEACPKTMSQAERSACLKTYSENAAAVSALETANANFYDGIINGLNFIKDGPVKIATAIVGSFLQFIIIPVLGTILRIVAACLDLAIQSTLNSTKLTDVSGSIVTIWALVRDIFNITFIFILLYTAIKMIIGSVDANTKKMIANVVIAALLINFSLFITRILIDAGNILATNLYNLATNSGANSISSLISNQLGLGLFWASTKVASVFETAFFIISALQLLTILIAIITLSYITALILIRNVMLIFLMALSPIGFMGGVIPKFEEYSKMWRENLYGQIFIAPIFLLLFYLITIIGTRLTPTGVTDKLLTDTDKYKAYFQYIMVIILLFAAVKITKKMSGVVGAVVEKVGMAAAGIALGAATGGAAFVGRATLGKAAASLGENKFLLDKSKEGGVRGIAARMALRSSGQVSKASFDARNTETFKKTTGAVGDYTGLKVDYSQGLAVQKGGYAGFIEAKQKRAEENVKMLGQTNAEKEAESKLKMFGERAKLQAEQTARETERKQAEKAIESLEAEQAKSGGKINNSDKVFSLQEKINRITERDAEIKKSVGKIEENYQASFEEDITKLTKADTNNLEKMMKAAQRRQLDYVSNYKKTIRGQFEGLSMNLAEKKKVAQKLRGDILKTETDIDKIIKGVTSKSSGATPPPASGGTPPPGTP